MKSRTSFFNSPVFRKNLTRFAPAWGIYSVILFLGYAVLMVESTDYYRASGLAGVIAGMALLNFGYAFINAQLLFGDLFSARLCNALHAMPLRRECWYGTHVISGLTFSLLPNLVFAVLGLLTMGLGKAWSVPLLWVLASTLQYFCFFGIAVLCMMLTGNRFAAALVYGLVNFFSMLVFWLVDSLYEPLLTGIRIPEKPFLYFSPLVNMVNNFDLVEVLSERILDANGDYVDRIITGVALGEGWGWTVVYAVFGVAMLALGLQLYRKRALECAGDFMAFRACEPVLLIVYTLTAGGVFYLFSDIFGYGAMSLLLLVMGLAVGFFTGLMLLQRTTRVFRMKNFGAFGLLTLAMGLTLGLTFLDPLGITRWVPEADEVVSVNLSSRYNYNSYSQGALELTEAADIQAILDAHEYIIGRTADDEIREFGINPTVTVCIEYTLKNGATRTRFYQVSTLNEAGQTLKRYFSSFEYVTGFREEEIPELAQHIFQVNAQGMRDNTAEYLEQMQSLDMEGLLRALAADCAAGNMAQEGSYHLEQNEYGVLDWDSVTYLEFGYRHVAENTGDWTDSYTSVTIYNDSVHTLNWMIENGLYDPEKNLG